LLLVEGVALAKLICLPLPNPSAVVDRSWKPTATPSANAPRPATDPSGQGRRSVEQLAVLSNATLTAGSLMRRYVEHFLRDVGAGEAVAAEPSPERVARAHRRSKSTAAEHRLQQMSPEERRARLLELRRVVWIMSSVRPSMPQKQPRACMEFADRVQIASRARRGHAPGSTHLYQTCLWLTRHLIFIMSSVRPLSAAEDSPGLYGCSRTGSRSRGVLDVDTRQVRCLNINVLMVNSAFNF
jgi:hypothetical protein